MSVIIVPAGSPALAGKPMEGLPFYSEGKGLIESYGGGICGCLSDPMSCLFACCCFPCAVGKVGGFTGGIKAGAVPGGRSVAQREKMSIGCCLCTTLLGGIPCACHGSSCSGQTRINLNKYLKTVHPTGKSEGDCVAFCCHFCPTQCCALAQELRAIKKYNELNPGLGSPALAEMER